MSYQNLGIAAELAKFMLPLVNKSVGKEGFIDVDYAEGYFWFYYYLNEDDPAIASITISNKDIENCKWNKTLMSFKQLVENIQYELRSPTINR